MPDNPHSDTLQSRGFQEFSCRLSANRSGLGPSEGAYLVGDRLNHNGHVAADLPHVADLEPGLGLMAHQYIAEHELVLILHKQPLPLCGLQDVVQVGTVADLVLLKYGGIVVRHEGWGAEGRLRGGLIAQFLLSLIPHLEVWIPTKDHHRREIGCECWNTV